MLCNWMVSTGVVGAMISTSVSGKGDRNVDAHHVVLWHDFRALGSQHVFVSIRSNYGWEFLNNGLLYLERDPTVLAI